MRTWIGVLVTASMLGVGCKGEPLTTAPAQEPAPSPASEVATSMPEGAGPGEPDGSSPDGSSPDGSSPDAGTPSCFSTDPATLLAERVGFGADTTGGDPSNVYHVTSLASSGPGTLRAALESASPYWIVFDVDGTITWDTRVKVASNKTVDGRGRDVLIEGEWLIKDVHNVILSDLKLKNELAGHCTQAGDVISAQGSGGADPSAYTLRDLWLNHLEVFLGGDGLVDINGGSRITLSWNHFHSHKKGLLLGFTTGTPFTGSRMTLHHNFFDPISLRGPQFLGGWAHYFNNYQFEFFEYGAGSLGGAQMYSEANVYEPRAGSFCAPCVDTNPCGDTEYGAVSKSALVTDWGGNGIGYTRSVGDLALNGAALTSTSPEKVFTPSAQYSYVAEPATPALATKVKAQAGPRTSACK